MFDKVNKSVLTYIQDKFKEVSVSFPVFYNSDISIINEYTRSLQARLLFSQYSTDGSSILSDNLTEAINTSNIILMYSYSPLVRSDSAFNNLNLEAYFKRDIMSELPEFKRTVLASGMSDEVQYLRDISATEHFKVRNAFYANYNMNFKFITSDTLLLDSLMVEYVAVFQKLRTLEVELDFGEHGGKMEFDYMVRFAPIETRQHIDYARYGNLQEMSFSANVAGLFLSYFTSNINPLREVLVKTELI